MSERYARQLVLPEIGPEGQERLRRASVLVIGAGGLGSPALFYLAAAGLGRIGIIESDVVDLSNLNRQILYSVADLGLPKAQVAAKRLREFNPEVSIDVYQQRFAEMEAVDLVSRYDILLDASDNFETRILANRAAVAADRPLVHGAVRQFEGQVAVFNYQGGPCYQCLYPRILQREATKADRAIVGAVTGMVGSMMANEAIKIALQKGSILSGKLLLVDALEASFRVLKVEKNPECPVCSIS